MIEQPISDRKGKYKMTVENILNILITRERAARMNGNTTELSFMQELVRIVRDYKRLKEQID